ncbi:MAG: hypothetical protein IJQ61_07920 [Bacteroidales bacterium]|nr:hypothetical protein [Bacteroidales bacterium]
MKQKLLYQSPTAEEFQVRLESSLLTTSPTDFVGGSIDGAIEEPWNVTFNTL